jgi:Zn-dependent M28 family amino/carboxypeptidase
MSSLKTVWMIALGLTTTTSVMAAGVSGASALNFTRHAVEFGPRPPGTPANTALQNYIIAELKKDGCEVIEDAFVANTPKGKVAMKNIIAKFPGKSGKAIALTGHFDTKLLPGKFVGADDGGSSTGILLELARVFARQPRVDDLYLAFFDGEEAFGEWSASDSLYGSRHLAERWGKDGTLKRLKGLINLDMIGDKNLGIPQETNGDASLRQLVWSMAATLGYKAYFTDQKIGEDDDHMPFVRAGVPAIDVIDVDYTPWHTDGDTMDKISAQSLEIVGTVIYESVLRLEHQ